ncbi:MAG TPA: helix-turn-helix transcriptional regulator [Candidatus Acidoferrum sp.]|nr:helix-turn-helix transcriptional regulator [Candidatus Acidoferrum sp.]
MQPGLRLRQARERLGFTYRDVERASYELAVRRGRPELILHISRLADIENRGVVPGLHKLYTLAVVYHLDPLEIFRWYDVPLEDCFPDGGSFRAPHTHLAAPPVALKTPLRFDPAFDPKRTELLSRMVERWGSLEGVLVSSNGEARHRYGYIGSLDRRMVPLLRPGSVVLVDVTAREIADDDWVNEFDRPMYFVEIRDGYRCGWFQQDRGRLVMQPHPLSRCVPETWRVPDEAEIVGRVVGVVTRLNEPWSILPGESPTARGDSSKKDL